MLRCLVLAVTIAVASAGFATGAAAMPKWEKDLLKRYTSTKPCDGRGAPAWGKASMARWRAAQHKKH
jgi:hypothetical protein